MSRFAESVDSRGEIISYGGSGGLVTGSCHRVNIDNSSFLIDCGLFQSEDEKRNFSFDRDKYLVNDILITHSHADHIGRLPFLFKEGLSPRILTTELTATFMETMLLNSAKIQEKKDSRDRLYDSSDVDQVLKHVKVVDLYTEVPVGQKNNRITAEFLQNGHVMGSNSIVIRRFNGDTKNILFTGDMGKPNQSLCGGYTEQVSSYPDDPVNVLVIESTNFNREPIPFKEKETNFLNTINSVWENGGNPLLPALSFHRLQEIIEILHNNQGGLIPDNCKIYIDAPLGTDLLEKFKDLKSNQLTNRYGDDPNFYKTEEESLNRFSLNNVIFIKSHEESVALSSLLSQSSEKVIVITGGGMGEYGRSVNYIEGNFCKNPKNAVIFTCYQVEGTLGSKLVNRKSIYGNGKGAKVFHIDGFTSHISGPQETFGFLYRFNLEKLNTVIINHGKNSSRLAMAEEFKRRGIGEKIILPSLNQRVPLFN